MAHFRSTIIGNRGQSSRLGSKVGGMNATISGWNVGASVTICHENGEDVIYINATGGSRDICPNKFIAKIRKIDGELVIDTNWRAGR